VVHTGDPRAGIQLVKGFHEIEQNAWRWTRAEFGVTLRVPDGAASKGGALDVKLTVPDPVIKHVKSTTLTAKIGNIVLEPQTFTEARDYTYARDIPASALNAEAVTIDFSLDKFLPAGAVDARELAIVVTTIGLSSK
jgi:hypothetical protein